MSAWFLSLLVLAADPSGAGLGAQATPNTQATSATQATPATTTAAVPATLQPVTPPDPMDKIVCRRQVETGSLVRAQRKCHSRRQWAYIDAQHQSAAEQLVDVNRGRQSGN